MIFFIVNVMQGSGLLSPPRGKFIRYLSLKNIVTKIENSCNDRIDNATSPFSPKTRKSQKEEFTPNNIKYRNIVREMVFRKI